MIDAVGKHNLQTINLADIRDQVQETLEAYGKFQKSIDDYAPQILMEDNDSLSLGLTGFTRNHVFNEVESLQIEILIGDLGFRRCHEAKQDSSKVRVWFRHSTYNLEFYLDVCFEGKYIPKPDVTLDLDIVPQHLLNDRYWRGLLFLFKECAALRPYLTEKYFDFTEGRVRFNDLKECASVWSAGERVLLDLAAHMFNDQQHDFHLSDLLDLDRQNFDLAQKAIRLRYGR